MNKKTITNAIFAVITTGTLLGASVAAVPNTSDSYDMLAVNRVTKQIGEEPVQTLDALILGDSCSYTAYAPVDMYSEYGFTSFNCATQAQRICDTYAILNEAYKTQSPSLVILDMNVITRKAGAYDEESKVLTAVGKFLPIFHYHSLYKTLKSPKELLRGTQRKETIGFKHKGYNGKYTTVPYEGETDYMNQVYDPFEIKEDCKEYLLAIRDLCRENNAELLLISTPSPVNWDASKHTAAEQWASENNLTYIDLNLMQDEVPINWLEDTTDAGDHLNVNGSAKTTAFLGAYVHENYKLPDHRGDEAYVEWAELIEGKEGK